MGGLTDVSSYNLSPSNYESESDRIKRILKEIEGEELESLGFAPPSMVVPPESPEIGVEQAAFDRYVPGEESPWGAPNVSGGNKEFYRNQFMNLLSDEQNFRDRQRQSSEIRDNAQPLTNSKPDWSWVEGGLPEVVVMESGYAQPLEGLNRPVTPDTPNYRGYGNIFGSGFGMGGSVGGGDVGSGSGPARVLINTSKK